MALKVVFEIGHHASLKTKRPHEIFTHDWEVFVRGADNTDVTHFVDKVVFQLHETFPKPKRVVKEPPYSVKESGYAGFNLPVEIHLKNREEPKKIRFNYDLHLQQSGPTISGLQKEKYVFQNPSEEFRRKLIKGGATPTTAHPLHANSEHDKNGADPFAEDRATQLIGKPKLGGDAKKHKPKEHRPEYAQFTNLFGPPIHKTSRASPDPKKPSPNPKADKKDKDRVRSDRDRPKVKRDSKERDHREERKPSKEEKEKNRDDKKQKSHKERDASKDKISKRPPERPPSPSPPTKRPAVHPSRSPRRVPSPSGKSNGSASGKEEIRQIKQPENRSLKIADSNPPKEDKKNKKDRKPHDKDRESKKERKEKESRGNPSEIRDGKFPKEPPIRENPVVKEKQIPTARPDRPINKFSIENMLKDPADANKYGDSLKQKGDHERKHKHKKKDKKRDESREKTKDAIPKDKKQKHNKQKEKNVDIKETFSTPEKIEPVKEIEKINLQIKNFKEKERNQYTISPIPLDTSSQSSSKSGSKVLKINKNNHSSSLSSTSDSDSDRSVLSESEDTSFTSETSKNARLSAKSLPPEPNRSEQIKSTLTIEAPKNEKSTDRSSVTPNHKLPKNKEKATNRDGKEDKKQRKRKSGAKGDDSENLNKMSKVAEDPEHTSKVKRSDLPKNQSEGGQKQRPETSSRSKSDTKVQDDGVSSSLSDNPLKSPIVEEESHVHEPAEISPDYMMQLQELQRRIMTIQSNDELERVVNLIAETGKYEVTKKTFDFDLCLLDRTTVQQLQELIGCESRA